MHSFSDFSGCVFLNTNTGETISVELALAELIKSTSATQDPEKKNTTTHEVIASLVNKGFLRSTANQDSNAE